MGVRRRPRPKIAYEGEWAKDLPGLAPAPAAPVDDAPALPPEEPDQPAPGLPSPTDEPERDVRGAVAVACHGAVGNDGSTAWTWVASADCWGTGTLLIPDPGKFPPDVIAELAAIEDALTCVPSNRTVIVLNGSSQSYDIIMDYIPRLLAAGKITADPASVSIADGSVIGLLQNLRYLLSQRVGNVDMRIDHGTDFARGLHSLAQERNTAALLLSSGSPMTFGPRWKPDTVIDTAANEIVTVEPTDLRSLNRW